MRKPEVLGTFFLIFIVLVSGLRLANDIHQNQGCINFFITHLDLTLVQQILSAALQKFQDMTCQKLKHHT